MILRQLFDYDTWTYTYLVGDPENRAAVLIDPVLGQIERDMDDSLNAAKGTLENTQPDQ